MKKLAAMVLACLMLAGVLSGCAGTANNEDVEYRWKMALNSTEGDNAYDTGVLFAQKVKELTNGRVRVDLYGGAQLGTTAEVLEGMYAGVADVMCESVPQAHHRAVQDAHQRKGLPSGRGYEHGSVHRLHVLCPHLS